MNGAIIWSNCLGFLQSRCCLGFCGLIVLLLLFLLSHFNVMCDLHQCQRPCGCVTCHLCPRARLWEPGVVPQPWLSRSNMPSRSTLPPTQFETFVKKPKKKDTHTPQPVVLTWVRCCPCLPWRGWIMCLSDVKRSGVQEGIAQVGVPEYMESAQQIPAGFVTLTPSHSTCFLGGKCFHTTCCLWSWSAEQCYQPDDFYRVSVDVLVWGM